MIENLKELLKSKNIHKYIIISIIIVILIITVSIVLKYTIKGEENIPFFISKIGVISNVEGFNQDDEQNKWNLSVSQNNDIYVYINKSENIKNQEIIKNIKLTNFKIEQEPKIGNCQLYRPDSTTENLMFKNCEENKIQEIEFTGSEESNIKTLNISNQGGIVAFRYSIENIGNYISNDDEEIKHNELLSKLAVNNEDLQFDVIFDVQIILESGKIYQTNVKVTLPKGNVVTDGIQSEEITSFDDLVYKRISN